MITILKLKKNFYSLIGFTSLTIFSQTTWAANPVADCAVSGAGVVTQIMGEYQSAIKTYQNILKDGKKNYTYCGLTHSYNSNARFV